MLFVWQLAANRTAFSGISPCVLVQNARHLAPKRSVFSGILHSIWGQTALKMVQMAIVLNLYSFCRMQMLSLFSIKRNLRENRFFARGELLVQEKGSYNVKILAKNKTFFGWQALGLVGWLGWVS